MSSRHDCKHSKHTIIIVIVGICAALEIRLRIFIQPRECMGLPVVSYRGCSILYHQQPLRGPFMNTSSTCIIKWTIESTQFFSSCQLFPQKKCQIQSPQNHKPMHHQTRRQNLPNTNHHQNPCFLLVWNFPCLRITL